QQAFVEYADLASVKAIEAANGFDVLVEIGSHEETLIFIDIVIHLVAFVN
ncbi:MAG: hypothetical protein JNM70_24670, partial [Anaerolineae bacterium]|nr:hypothetical protein [Anaerolineae bacterium]